MTATKLSKMEADCLMHRLEVPDAIGEVLADEYGYDDQQVADAISAIEQSTRDGVLHVPTNDVERAVLRDCIEGSTWLVGVYENHAPRGHKPASCEVSHATYRRHLAAFWSLAGKLKPHIGEWQHIPAEAC